MSDTLRNRCPKCGKPMVVLLAKDRKVAALKCLDCEEIDPLADPQIERWIESSSLKPPHA